MGIGAPGEDNLTDTQRAILDALQRPLREGGPYASPATNRQIADEVYLSVDAVKGHLRVLYARLGIDSLPQNAKRARLAEIGLSGAVDGTLPPRPPQPTAPAPAAVPVAVSQRGRIPAMLSAVALGLVLLGVVVGLMLGHDGGDTIISQEPDYDRPADPGKGSGGKGTLLGGLPGPWSDDGLFAAGPPVPAGYELSPGTAGAAPVSDRTSAPRRRSRDRAEARTERGRSSPERTAGPAPASPAPAATTPAVTTAPTPTRRARRTCSTRRQVTYRPVTVTVRRVRLHPHRVRQRVVSYRREVRMVPVTRQVPNGTGDENGKRKGKGKGKGKGKQRRNANGTHPETVMVRQVRRLPVVRYVTRVRQHRHVSYVKVIRRKRVVRSVRTCS